MSVATYRRWLLLAAVCGSLSGCAVYDPYRVWRYGIDFNTERQLSAQWEVNEHLPPKHVAVQLMKWGYNVGPSPMRAPAEIPPNSPVAPVVPVPEGVLPGNEPDELDQAQPPVLPPSNRPLPPDPTGLPNRPQVEFYGPTAHSAATSSPIMRTSATATAPRVAGADDWMFFSRR